jgi:hypothetical protein
MNLVLKIPTIILGSAGLGLGALHVMLAVFGLGGMDPSFSGTVGIVVPLMAEVLALGALIILWWRPRVAAGLFLAASALFFGSLVHLCIVFAHLAGIDLLAALFTTPHNALILPAWLPLLLAGGISQFRP